MPKKWEVTGRQARKRKTFCRVTKAFVRLKKIRQAFPKREPSHEENVKTLNVGTPNGEEIGTLHAVWNFMQLCFRHALCDKGLPYELRRHRDRVCLVILCQLFSYDVRME